MSGAVFGVGETLFSALCGGETVSGIMFGAARVLSYIRLCLGAAPVLGME